MSADAISLGAYLLAMLIAFLTGYRIGHSNGRDTERMNWPRPSASPPPWRNPGPPEGWQGGQSNGTPNPPQRNP